MPDSVDEKIFWDILMHLIRKPIIRGTVCPSIIEKKTSHNIQVSEAIHFSRIVQILYDVNRN